MIKGNKKYFFVIGLFVMVFLLPFKYLLHFSLDDSFFYVKTAFNFASGKGSSFDSINFTNGYHPLWFLLLSIIYLPLTYFKNVTPEFIYRLTFLVAIIIDLFTIYFLNLVIKLIYGKNETMVITLTIMLLTPLVFLNIIGMESQIEILLLSTYLSNYLYSIASPSQKYFRRSLIFGMLLLTRIEFVLFLLPFILLLEISLADQSNPRSKFKSILFFLLIPIVLLSVYYFSNYYFFGRLESISSIIKISLVKIKFFDNLPYPNTQPINFIIFIFIIISGLIYFIIIKKRISQILNISLFKAIEYIYFCGLLILIANYFFNQIGCAEWYYSTASFGSVLLISPIVILSRPVKIFIMGVAGIILLCYFTIFRINYYHWDEIYDYSKMLKKIVGENERIFQFNVCGIIGFFSERKVINGDGFINSFEYYDILKSGKLNNYLNFTNVKYYGTDSFVNLVRNGQFFEKKNGYLFQYPSNRVKLNWEFKYGGIFRNKKGYLYLIRIKP